MRNLILALGCILAFANKGIAQNLTFNSYTGQSQISTNGSITLGNGFYVPFGNNLRVFTITGTPPEPCLAELSAPSTNMNFVSSRTFKVPGVNSLNVNIPRSVCDVNESITYLDGLGRPLQTVDWKASPKKKDIVQPFAYDGYGREVVRYLPYAEASGSGGSYKATAISDQAGFYSAGSWDANVARTTSPFSRTVFEPSPLNRVLEQGAPGAVWQPASMRNSTGGRTVAQAYATNTADDLVKLWSVTANGANSTMNYPAGRLFRNSIKDENWTSGNQHTVDEYKDMEGKVVLKRTWQNATVALNTYYIYDDLDNLRYVVPPAVTASSFTESDAVFNNFIYGYHYDGRKRVREKKVPGKGWEYMVYNKLDQVAISQDANQRSKSPQQWTVNKYDAFGRVVISGIHLYGATAGTSNLDAMQGLVDAQPYQWEEQIGSGIGYSVNRTYPTAALSVNLKVNYYDSYAIPGLPGSFNQAGIYSPMLKGLPTASLTNVLGTVHDLWTVMYYDNEGRVVKTRAQHFKSGAADTANYDETVVRYNFAGQDTASVRRHFVSGVERLYVANSYTYDHAGRKVDVAQKTGLNSATANPKVVLSRQEYNEIGQLKQKHLHSIDGGGNFKQSTKYAYNERGWLKNSASPQFSMKLGYDTLSSPQYNGNISTQLWGSSYGNSFNYVYDGLNRLTSAISTGVVMNETIGYDVMGNITSLTRYDGNTSLAGTYNYGTSGNRLQNISGGGLATGSYSYDANGNATTDGRTGVALTYNVLNLPSTAIKSGLNLAYTYDADGRKLRKVATTTGTTTTDYVDGIQYTNGAIDFVQTEEGRALNSSGSYSYQYNLSDHLGNVRYSFDIYADAVRKLQEDNYYAFGKRRGVTGGSNNYLYNGKELQDGLETYDYGARFYDPVIGRWNVVDPLAEGRSEMTPYHYVSNNPINRVDPDGRWDWYQSNATGTVKWFEGSGEQDGFRHIGAQGTVTSSGENAGVVNLNSDGSATNAATGEQATYSTSGKTKIVEKDNTSNGYKMFLDIFSGGAYSRESRALDILDRDGLKAYNYQKVADAHTEIFQGWMAGEYQLGASASRAAKLSVDDVLNNPSLLQGKPLSQVQNALGKTEGWVNDVMRRSTRAEGWVLREMNPAGTDPTGRMIQYHPGTPRHFGGQPYWKVSTGPGGTVRIPQQP